MIPDLFFGWLHDYYSSKFSNNMNLDTQNRKTKLYSRWEIDKFITTVNTYNTLQHNSLLVYAVFCNVCIRKVVSFLIHKLTWQHKCISTVFARCKQLANSATHWTYNNVLQAPYSPFARLIVALVICKQFECKLIHFKH